MSDLSPQDFAPRSRRSRRNAASELFVIARGTDLPPIQLRRLGPRDRPALIAHFAGLLPKDPDAQATPGLDAGTIARLVEALDFGRTLALGAVAGHRLLAAGIATQDGPARRVVATCDAAWRGRGLRRMVASQVLGALDATPAADPAADALAQLAPALGARVISGG